MNTLFVRVTTSDRRVVLHERHARHPGGEVWLAGTGRSYLVGNTAAVRARLADGRLVLLAPIADLVDAPAAPEAEIDLVDAPAAPDADPAPVRDLPEAVDVPSPAPKPRTRG